MSFKAKLRRIGNSVGIYVPRKKVSNYEIGEEVEFQVITTFIDTKKEQEVITPKADQVITHNKFDTGWCSKHNTYKGTCGCK